MKVNSGPRRYVVASANMVHALLRGEPVQVWEPIPDFPKPPYAYMECGSASVTVESNDEETWGRVEWPDLQGFGFVSSLRWKSSPAYTPRAVVHVREAWRTVAAFDGIGASEIARQCLEAGYRKPWVPVHYEADGAAEAPLETWWCGWSRNPRTPLAMPYWASRLSVRVASVRGLRLDSMTDADAALTRTPLGYNASPGCERERFRMLWDLKFKRPQYAVKNNPWCWCYELHPAPTEVRSP